ncbi:nucleoside-diphosphate kinase [Kitasatospora sp. NPDC101157]|uniref:nucleoside-diphosphate kinase n=1 Tax=Kitasatospora sp. NPDC101157 TaxID=3364098 RepID=UPI003825AA36
MLEPDRFAVLVVKPDGVAQHLTRLISLWTRDRGYKLRGFRELILSPEHQLILDADTQVGGRIDRQLSEVFYGLGPAHALLLEREGSRSSDKGSAAAELAGITGDVLPHRARPGTLRGDFGALNPVFNLVHVTSGTDYLDRDARALFDRPLVELLGLNGARPDGISQTPHLLRPFKLWSVVADILAAWLGPEVVRPTNWPAESHGPSHPAVGAALMACTRAAQRAGGENGEVLTGVLDGRTSYVHFARQVPMVDTWHGYLAYTTLRHLTLCADTP